MNIDFNTNHTISKFEKLKDEKIKLSELNLSQREIRWILICLKSIHCWEELLDKDLGL